MSPRRRGWRRAVQKVGRHSVNAIAVGLLMRGLHAPPYSPSSALVMETVGRRSGKRRRTPMGYLREGPATLLVVSEHGARSDWVRNGLAAGSVVVWLGKDRHSAALGVSARDPREVLGRIGKLLHSGMVTLMAFDPKVIEVTLLD